MRCPSWETKGFGTPEVALVIPVFNEESCIASVLEEWAEAIHQHARSFVILVINDGSTDSTGAILDRIAKTTSEIRVIHCRNAGHGQACRIGYRLGISSGAHWILQIDSDGQCDPAFFREFWEARHSHPAVLGYRVSRGDGLIRILISRVLRLAIFFLTRLWVPDANVPYRLIHRVTVEAAIVSINEKAQFTNILLSCFLTAQSEVHWIPIAFRPRRSGHSMFNPATVFRCATRALSEVSAFRRQTR